MPEQEPQPQLSPQPQQIAAGASKNSNWVQTVFAASIGLVLIIFVLYLASNNDCDHSKSLNNLYRIVLSIAVGAIASIIPGNFEFKYKKVVTATGAVGVVALVYLYNPAAIVNDSDGCSVPFITGTVYINNKAQNGAEVRFQQQSVETANQGDFAFPYRKDKKIKKFKFRIIYGSLDKDTTVNADSLEGLKFKFRLDTGLSVNARQPVSGNVHPTPENIARHEFIGVLQQSTIASYGGGKYCGFSMRYYDIKMKLKLSNDEKDVITSKVTFKAIESASPGCPFQTGAPNTHIYDKASTTIDGNTINITYVADKANNPSCSLTFSGTIVGNKIIGTLHSIRIDMPDPVLVYEISMDMVLEK